MNGGRGVEKVLKPTKSRTVPPLLTKHSNCFGYVDGAASAQSQKAIAATLPVQSHRAIDRLDAGIRFYVIEHLAAQSGGPQDILYSADDACFVQPSIGDDQGALRSHRGKLTG